MQNKIKDSVKYYTLKAERFEKSGLAPAQARVHRELAELVKDCKDLEDAQNKIRALGYYDKPAQALYVDKMANHARAARENDLPEIASIYEARRQEVEADYQKAFELGFEKKINDELARLNENVATLDELARLYLQSLMTVPENPQYQTIIAAAQTKISKLRGMTVTEALNRPYLRKHLAFDDRQLESFRAWLSLETPAPTTRFDEEIASLKQFISENEDRLMQVGSEFEKKCSRRGVLYVSPEKEPGPNTKSVLFESPA